jgi:hypothetical protein
MADELERDQQAELPLWERPSRLREVDWVVLVALLASAIGAAWILCWE